ncbi:rifin PIR protein,putative [Plasmodium sp. DRC-Itaito]|nr:rifin PIR protein,putative [Plasmodium sp. DRC-Itaito]
MKLQFTRILLFAFLLNIMLTSYKVNTHRKTYVTQHHTTRYISRALSECDIQSSIYDNDVDMKCVKEVFDRQTSQRFEEYEERMKEKRQKHKEQRDKNIQEIIEEDKMEKSLVEKIEKSCLRCGCGLGGVAASVGLFGGLGIYGWEMAEVAAVAQKGTAAGIDAVIKAFKTKFGLETISGVPLNTVLNANNFKHPMRLYQLVQGEYNIVCKAEASKGTSLLCSYKRSIFQETYKAIVVDAQTVANDAGQAAATVEAGELAKVAAESSHLYSAIGYSVLSILIIVLILVIVYLVLRYRRKTKMKKKTQYTKLLNQ